MLAPVLDHCKPSVIILLYMILYRFHHLDEFDEGKRSCRQRLAGHNRRRRKTRPDVSFGGAASVEDKVSNYLLLSLLGICANLNCKFANVPCHCVYLVCRFLY